MVELLTPRLLGAIGCLAAASAVMAQGDSGGGRHQWILHGSSSIVAVDTPDSSWLEGGLGKLRYDESTSPATFDRLLLQYRGTLTPTLFAHVDADYADGADGGFGVTEAFLEWRPVPRSPTRHRLRLGAFYPRSSLENVDSGWESPYSISFSALNSWLAEEVRLLGAEWALERHLGDPSSPQLLTLFGTVFYGNDPSGALLAWKGWGIHDRQTRWAEQLPFAPVPVLEPMLWPGQTPADIGTVLSPNQAPVAEPFLEIDHEPGTHVGLEWRYAKHVLIAASRYDNRADPMSIGAGQYGWRTIFDQVALQAALPWGVGLMAQWMSGTTAMGPVLDNGRRAVDADFEASYAMLTRDFGRYRISLRYDDFAVYDADILPDDHNGETGDGITVAYIRELRDDLTLAVEWLRVHSTRPARAQLGLAPESTEQVLRAELAWRIASWPN